MNKLIYAKFGRFLTKVYESVVADGAIIYIHYLAKIRTNIF